MADHETIVRVENAVTWQLHACTDLVRIVFMYNNSPVGVAPVGDLWVPLAFFKKYNYNQLAFVTIGPHHASIPTSPSLITKDGIPLSGELSFEYRVRTSEIHLMLAAARFSAQYAAFTDRVMASLQRVLAQHTYSGLDEFRVRAHSEVISDFANRNSDDACSLELVSIHTHRLDAADQKLRDTRLRMKQLEEEAAIQAREARWASERAAEDARTKLIEAQNSLEVERLRQEQQLALQAKKAELLRTEEGQMSEDMEVVFQHKARKLEIEKLVAQLNDRQSRDVLRAVLSHQSGQNSVLRALAANQIGIKLTDETSIAEGLKRLADGVDSEELESEETA